MFQISSYFSIYLIGGSLIVTAVELELDAFWIIFSIALIIILFLYVLYNRMKENNKMKI